MIKLYFLIIAAIAAIIVVLFSFYKDRIIGFAWGIFFKNVSDEKLEKIVRDQYELYNQDRKAFNDDGLCWLIDMARHMCFIWKDKVAAFDKDLVKAREKQMQILSYWQEALQQLTYEENRRKYFLS
ncbi:MAG: hypothetical protein OSJ76_00160 [Alphaproteobacteria bacterium]|nr:hypothetical protein [Alphaproteobacteria bacterium]